MSIFEDTDHIEDVGLLQRRMSCEGIAISDALESLARFVPQIISNLTEAASSFFSRITGGNAEVSNFNFRKSASDTPKILQDFDFLTYESVLMQVPEGFHGNLVDYLKFLSNIGDNVIHSATKAMTDYISLLGSVISVKDFRQGLQDRRSFIKTIEHKREEAVKQLSKFLDGRSTTSRLPIGKVMDRFAEVREIFEAAAVLSAFTNSYNYQQLGKQVNEAVELLKIIDDYIRKGEIDNMSVQMTRNIADGAYEMGKFIEFVAIYAFHVESALACVKNFDEQLRGFKK